MLTLPSGMTYVVSAKAALRATANGGVVQVTCTLKRDNAIDVVAVDSSTALQPTLPTDNGDVTFLTLPFQAIIDATQGFDVIVSLDCTNNPGQVNYLNSKIQAIQVTAVNPTPP